MPGTVEPAEESQYGFAIVDGKGRVTLPKGVRAALGLTPGATIAYVVVKGRLVIYPQDEEFVRLAEDAAAIVEAAVLTTQDLLDELPAVRERVMRRTYGDAFVDELARKHAGAPATRGD